MKLLPTIRVQCPPIDLPLGIATIPSDPTFSNCWNTLIPKITGCDKLILASIRDVRLEPLFEGFIETSLNFPHTLLISEQINFPAPIESDDGACVNLFVI